MERAVQCTAFFTFEPAILVFTGRVCVLFQPAAQVVFNDR